MFIKQKLIENIPTNLEKLGGSIPPVRQPGRRLVLSYEYMNESYDQARKYGAKWLLIERIIGVFFVFLGASLYIYVNGKTVMPIALTIIGIFELFSNSIKKFFWLRRHTKSKLMNAEIEVSVSDSGIDSSGPFSNGHFDWSGVEKVVRTPKGILVWPQKGIYWYLPESIAGKQAIEFIQSKVA